LLTEDQRLAKSQLGPEALLLGQKHRGAFVLSRDNPEVCGELFDCLGQASGVFADRHLLSGLLFADS